MPIHFTVNLIVIFVTFFTICVVGHKSLRFLVDLISNAFYGNRIDLVYILKSNLSFNTLSWIVIVICIFSYIVSIKNPVKDLINCIHIYNLIVSRWHPMPLIYDFGNETGHTPWTGLHYQPYYFHCFCCTL